ncbi:MAG: DUF1294 domain-containing protein [Oscillospiraceae bacterium]|nr:DUF1294 domain-containing protein [Oscillospiraceae bacterium]
MDILFCYLLIINALGLLLMHIDKQKAIKNQWRIPERVLIGIGILGGSLGCIAGMRIFHHKTKHLAFWLGLPLILFAQIMIGIFLYTKF